MSDAPRGDAGYRDAIARLLARLAPMLADVPRGRLPMRVVVAGGAAAFLHTGIRVSQDVDATLSLRIHLPDDLVETYTDDEGEPRSVYLDANYNDTLGPLHESAFDEAQPVELHGVDKRVIDVRVLTPIDLAISKLGRFSDRDREDIRDLARLGLLDAGTLEARAREALECYVGRPSAPRANLRAALRIIRGEG